MTMVAHLEDFALNLHQEVLASSGEDESPRLREEKFTEAVLERLAEHNEADGADIVSYEARGTGRLQAAKLNAWSLSGDGATLDLFVTKYFGSGQVEELGKPETRRHFELLSGFLRRALDRIYTKIEESSAAFKPALTIYEALGTLTTVRLFLLTDGVIRSLDIEEIQFSGLDVRYIIWDLEKLSRLRVGQREAIELDFVNDYGGPVSCLQTADATGEYRTFLAFLAAPVLAQIYGAHGQRLLERNVRAFLQAKGKVNRGLQNTLRNEPHRFLAYNNGLCCTAADIRLTAGRDGHAMLEWVKDFQIVNGAQTTASIYHALKKERVDVTQVMVQMKLTVLRDASKVQEIVPRISQYANSQNTVKGADLEANGPYHLKLEQLSRTIWAPAPSGLERGSHWYYERARGSYADDKVRQGSPRSQREWESQNPPNQRFTKTDVAKFEHTWMGLPHLTCLGAEKNFLRFAERLEEDGEPIVDQTYFQHLVAKAILYRTAENLFSLQRLEGYRANSVAYGVSWLVVQSGHRIDLKRIWEQGKVSMALGNALRGACAAAHAHITSQPGNPGEASKRETCWREFVTRDLHIDQSWEAESAPAPFGWKNSEENSLGAQWEEVRGRFRGDLRTIGEVAALTGKSWVVSRYGDSISSYTERSWEELRATPRLGLKKLRGLVELFAAAEPLPVSVEEPVELPD